MRIPEEGEYYLPFEQEDNGGTVYHNGAWYELLSHDEIRQVTIH
jgi:hypothetical protein